MTFPGGNSGGNPGGHSGGHSGGQGEPGSFEASPSASPPPGYQHPDSYGQAYRTYPDQYGPPARPGTNTMAIASLVASVVGFAPYFGGILSIVGIVLGSVALNQIKETPQEGYGLAVAGIVVGVATLIIGLIWTIYAIR